MVVVHLLSNVLVISRVIVINVFVFELIFLRIFEVIEKLFSLDLTDILDVFDIFSTIEEFHREILLG